MDWDDPYAELNRGLLYKEDTREDEDRFETFCDGWNYANSSEGRDYGERAFKELSWHNLGYRLGLLFGPASREARREMYDWCVAQKNK